MNVLSIIFGNRKRIAVSLFFVLIFGIGGCQDKATINEQQKKIEELRMKINELSSKTNLDIEDKCAKQAREVFNSEGFNLKKDSYTNHFNKKFNKCFIEIYSLASRDGSEDRYLIDAFEHKAYAELHLYIPTGKRIHEVNTIFSKILEKPCNTEEEYKAFIKSYMEEN